MNTIALQNATVLKLPWIGNLRPRAIATNNTTTPAIVETTSGACLRYTKNPNAMASGMNRIDAVATEPLAAGLEAPT